MLAFFLILSLPHRRLREVKKQRLPSPFSLSFLYKLSFTDFKERQRISRSITLYIFTPLLLSSLRVTTISETETDAAAVAAFYIKSAGGPNFFLYGLFYMDGLCSLSLLSERRGTDGEIAVFARGRVRLTTTPSDILSFLMVEWKNAQHSKKRVLRIPPISFLSGNNKFEKACNNNNSRSFQILITLGSEKENWDFWTAILPAFPETATF